MRFLYIVIAYLLAPVVVGALALRGFRDRGHWQGFSQRFGLGEPVREPGIWVHAVSVGEVQAAAPLVNALLDRFPAVPLVLTTVTPTGRDRARALFKDRVDVRYVPIDLPGAVRRFFVRVKPRLAVILETEIWPNLYNRCGKLGVPLVMASARISPKSVNRYRRLVGLFRDALSHGIFIAAQSAEDAERFRSIGASAERTHVIGNIKFDFGYPPDIEARGHELRRLLGVHRPVWVAGSTHAKEEDVLLDAHALIRQRYTNALLVMVPRHPPRFDDVAAAMESRNVPYVRRTSGAAPGPTTQVFLLDTLGELPPFYAAGDVAFVGGSLVPIGGHNLLEAAAAGIPAATGPFVFNFAQITELLIDEGAAVQIADAEGLARRMSDWLGDAEIRAAIGENGRRVVEENRGALQRLLALLEARAR
jgi:3-deoxy-D-manno-octulosonic-acid transferase